MTLGRCLPKQGKLTIATPSDLKKRCNNVHRRILNCVLPDVDHPNYCPAYLATGSKDAYGLVVYQSIAYTGGPENWNSTIILYVRFRHRDHVTLETVIACMYEGISAQNQSKDISLGLRDNVGGCTKYWMSTSECVG